MLVRTSCVCPCCPWAICFTGIAAVLHCVTRYQWWFAVAFLVNLLSPKLGNLVLYLGLALRVSPDTSKPRARWLHPPAGPRAWQCAIYYQFWKAAFSGRVFRLLRGPPSTTHV